MEEQEQPELPPFHVDITERAPVEILYACKTCGDTKTLFQPYPQDVSDDKFPMFCWFCRAIQQHKRILPSKPK